MKLSLPRFSIPRIKVGETSLVTIITIIQQPVNSSASLGSQTSLSCLAITNNNIKPNYQWQSSTNNSNFININGANESVYSFTATVDTNNIFYRCVVTAKYAQTVTSNSAQFTILENPAKMTIYKLIV